VVRVETGAAAITPNFMPHVTIELIEGSSVTFGYDAGNDVFRIEPDSENLSPIAIRTANGFIRGLCLDRGSLLWLIVRRSWGDFGPVIFDEIAGAPNTANKQPPFRPGIPPLINDDPVLINQHPVTTIE